MLWIKVRMQIKVYVPQMVELADDYFPALIRRVVESLGSAADETPATRGLLVRQAVLDGLLRSLDPLKNGDGAVDLLCDPSGEFPLESDGEPLTVAELARIVTGPDQKIEDKNDQPNDGGSERKNRAG